MKSGQGILEKTGRKSLQFLGILMCFRYSLAESPALLPSCFSSFISVSALGTSIPALEALSRE